MQNFLEESDIELLAALQISPRAKWADLAEILRSNPVSLAQRWQNIRAAGSAWVTGHPSGRRSNMLLSFVQVSCDPRQRAALITRLSADARAVTIEVAAEGRDLLLTVHTPNLQELSKFTLDEISSWPGVLSHHTSIVTAIHHQGSDWYMPALAKQQVTQLRALSETNTVDLAVVPPKEVWPYLEILARDGRATAADLSRATGRNQSTVRRQLARLLSSGLLTFRCDLAQGKSYWPVSCNYLVKVPQNDLAQTVAALKTLPELRLCVSTTGSTNLRFMVWVRSVYDLHRIERVIATHLPTLQVSESVVTMRTPKRMGWVLNEDGTPAGQVVVPTPHEREFAKHADIAQPFASMAGGE